MRPQIRQDYFFKTTSLWGAYTTDFLLLYFPGLIAIGLSRYLPSTEDSGLFLIFTFIAAGFLDSGHVYVTAWRTYFLPQERRRTWIYWIAPVLFFCLFYIWTNQEWGYLAAVIVYATVFHNVRQLLGLSRWYQRKNNNWIKLSDLFLYLLCFLPFLAFHFRTDTQLEHYYSSQELFRYPSRFWFQSVLIIYSLVALVWVGFELARWRTYQEWNRIFSVLFAGIFYGYAFLLGKTVTQVLFPLVVSHGFAYLALMDLSLKKIHRGQKKRHNYLTIAILLTALVFGGLEFLVESEWLQVESSVKAFTTALLLTPLFCHYLFDSFLWKKSHPDSKSIYS